MSRPKNKNTAQLPTVSFPNTLSSVTTKELGTENATSPTCNERKTTPSKSSHKER